MIDLTSLKCPECGSILDIPENKEFFFCQFCGARIMLNNDNEKIIHKVDEAELKRAETEEKVKMLEMELKLKELENTEKHKKRKIIYIALCIIGLIIVFTINHLSPNIFNGRGFMFKYIFIFILLGLLASFTTSSSDRH